MICPQCYGRRPTIIGPCKTCGGTGYLYCCEGIVDHDWDEARLQELEQHAFGDGREETIDDHFWDFVKSIGR